METLVVKTFVVLTIMLLITAFSTRLNKALETRFELWGLLLGNLALVIIIPFLAFPLNGIVALVFACTMGLMIGPGIQGLMMRYVLKQRLKAGGYDKARLKSMPPDEVEALSARTLADITSSNDHTLVADWNRILGLAIASTATITIIAGYVVFAFDYDFSFLGQVLFIALLGLIVTGLLNVFFFKSALMRLVGAYVGAVIFSLYLLYDFGRLKEAAGSDSSWETAVGIAVSIYLDIVNLFLDLLEILSD